NLGNGDEVAGIDLGLVFLGAPRPHGALNARLAFERAERLLHRLLFRELAHADGRKFCGRHSKRHLVLLEVDDEELKLGTGNFLFFDTNDPADTVRRIDNILVSTKAMSLLRFLFVSHTSSHSLKWSARASISLFSALEVHP